MKKKAIITITIKILKINEKNKRSAEPPADIVVNMVAETDSLGSKVLIEKSTSAHPRAINENVSLRILLRKAGWIAKAAINVPRTAPIKIAVICVYDIKRGAFIAEMST